MTDSLLARIQHEDRIAMLTAYDYSTARLCEAAGIDIILVGDSLAMVVQGKPNTHSVTMDEMLYHTTAVCRGATQTLIVGDMPLHSYDTPENALDNARRFLEAGAQGVKVEGNCAPVIERLVAADIPVMGHIGLLPQTAEAFKVQGRDSASAARLREDAKSLDRLGVFALVLECLPAALAKEITAATSCKTIGIGAGPHCNGQVLVIHDLLGLYDALRPRFVRRYAELGTEIIQALERYRDDVKSGRFPAIAESYN